MRSSAWDIEPPWVRAFLVFPDARQRHDEDRYAEPEAEKENALPSEPVG
jgi:hypothetical protein